MNAAVHCEHGARCAGCAHLGVPYDAQLAAKGRRVEEALRRYPALGGVTVRPARAADPPLGYRTRVKWMVGPRGELGLFARDRSHEVVDVPACRIVSAPVATAGAALRRMLARREPPGIDRLRAVDLRELRDGDVRVWVTLVFARGSTPEASALRSIAAELRRDAPLVASVFVNEVEAESVQVLGKKTETITGASEAWDQVAGVRLLAAPGSFVQAHSGQATAIADVLRARVRRLIDELGRPPRVVDLFAGSGTWGLAAASEGADVLAIESYAPAASRVMKSARAAGHAVSSRAEDAERAARELARAGERFDLVVVNPPRRGIGPGLRASIAALAPREVAYVSCDPETLARDLSDLARLGLAPTDVLPIDMIPLTDHVETLALLAPAAPPPIAPIESAGALSFFDKPPHVGLDAMSSLLAGDARRPRRCLGPPPPASGVAAVYGGAEEEANRIFADARAFVRIGVKGVARKRGTLRDRAGRTFRYAREAVASGHSLLRVECDLEAVAHVSAPLASIGHPPLGGADVDPRTRRHIADRFGLDRIFLHVARVEAGGLAADAPVAPDLALVVERMGFPRSTSEVGSG